MCGEVDLTAFVNALNRLHPPDTDKIYEKWDEPYFKSIKILSQSDIRKLMAEVEGGSNE